LMSGLQGQCRNTSCVDIGSVTVEMKGLYVTVCD